MGEVGPAGGREAKVRADAWSDITSREDGDGRVRCQQAGGGEGTEDLTLAVGDGAGRLAAAEPGQQVATLGHRDDPH